MEMIFPGMDPYLEEPDAWQALHTRFIVELANDLQTRLSRRYATAVSERVYVESFDPRSIYPDVHVRRKRTARRGRSAGTAVMDGSVDVAIELELASTEVREAYVKIIDLRSKHEVVTVIEAISPTNKNTGPGRDSYLKKQTEVLDSRTHLVEIDLLRKGPHVAAIPEWLLARHKPYDYVVCVNRAEGERGKFRVYPIRLRDSLPTVYVPLAGDDADAPMNLRGALERAYGFGSFRELLPYGRPCVPKLSASDQAWADQQLRRSGIKKKTR